MIFDYTMEMENLNITEICGLLQEVVLFYKPNCARRRVIVHAIKTMVSLARESEINKITTVAAICSTQIFSENQTRRIFARLRKTAIENRDIMTNDVINN